ncbi:MAG: alpha/beta hydrolase, partial [Tomitella sp.]|nr:alpha/beta hydrolase [Tomitella sp.]
MQNITFALIPGAGGSAWYWHLVERELRHHDHETVAVALPAADHAAGLPDYAAAVVRAVGESNPRPLVLVAQSLGGFTAPLVYEQIAVSLLVLINAMIPKPGETPGSW